MRLGCTHRQRGDRLRHREKIAVYKPKREAAGEASLAHLDLGFPGSRTVRKCTSVFECPQAVVLCGRSPSH